MDFLLEEEEDNTNNNDIGIIETSNTFHTLIPAKEWAAKKSKQCNEYVPFLVIRTEQSVPQLGKVWRTFKVMEVQTFLDDMASPGPKFYHELTPADCVCNTYAEFDFGADKFEKFAEYGADSPTDLVMVLNTMLARFERVLISNLNAMIKANNKDTNESDISAEPLTVADDIIVLSSHKPGKKWSIHIVVSPAVGRESVVWRSTVDCGNFISRIVTSSLNDKLLCAAIDMGVYSSNHTLRTLGSAKSDEPTRILRYERDSVGAAYNNEVMIRSLVTLVRVARRRIPFALEGEIFKQTERSEPMVLLTSAFIGKYRADIDRNWRPLTCGNGPLGVVSDLDLLTRRSVGSRAGGNTAYASPLVTEICMSKEFAKFKPAKTFVVLTSEKIVLPCEGRFCGIKGEEHDKKHKPVYLLLDMADRLWQQRCHVTACRNTEISWVAMEESLAQLCSRYLSEECSLCKPVTGVIDALFGDDDQETI
jgi:hypothetical protein